MTATAAQILAGWNKLPAWAKTLLYGLDKSLNARLGGDPTETVSRRLRKARDAGKWEGKLGCSILNRYDPGHCDRA